MPTVSREGELRLPVVYGSWAEWRDERREPGEGLEPPPLVTHQFCARCWGQGRIHAPAANGEGLVPVACATCDGTGRLGSGR